MNEVKLVDELYHSLPPICLGPEWVVGSREGSNEPPLPPHRQRGEGFPLTKDETIEWALLFGVD
jgi:hypothetical protein